MIRKSAKIIPSSNRLSDTGAGIFVIQAKKLDGQTAQTKSTNIHPGIYNSAPLLGFAGGTNFTKGVIFSTLMVWKTNKV